MAHRRRCTDEEILEILTRSDSFSVCGIFNECSDDKDSSEECRSRTPLCTSPSRARQDSSSSDSESEDKSIRKRPRHSENEKSDGQRQDLLKFIALETNRCFIFTMANTSQSVRSRLSTWKDTGFEEMYSFIGIWLLMACVQKLRIKNYWSIDVLLSTPIFGEVMSCDRFMLLLRMFHVSDNSANCGDDILFRIRKIIDTVRVAFHSAFNPYRKLCVDERLLLFKRRLSFKQYIPSKRSRFGIKTFVLCNCKTAYVLGFIIYTGTTTEIEVHNLGKSGDIVATLMKPYLERGHTLNSYPDSKLWNKYRDILHLFVMSVITLTARLSRPLWFRKYSGQSEDSRVKSSGRHSSMFVVECISYNSLRWKIIDLSEVG
ncbi:piggyBac transposable element-derived protein 4-like [Schistocerca piceifrons]|uniref:piggyBac transposable element-derived protein 4-like n=1 Tax=Schistocerca piceifrons TaxID=274613 RepID=UPI001F5F83A8|nr:piggyBac transposable element-derived protein 4-like [Schistocerca piceifrons]